ncbi:MAG: hypothetical protein PUP90_16910 [Nostoc sp. S4]|nr:hypothetical protein [Nostoc sp. S4]
MLESIEVPAQQLVVPIICDELINLGIQSFKNVKIYGRVTDEDFPDWQQEIELEALVNSSVLISQTKIEVESSIAITQTTDDKLTVQKPSFLGSLFGAVAGTAGIVGGAAVQAGQAATGAAIGISGSIGGAAVQAGQAVSGAPVGISGAIGGAAFQVTQIVGQALAIVGNNPQLQVAIKSLNQD